MIKLCKYLSTMWNRTDSRFVAGLNNIPDRFLCKADFILSRHFTLLHSRFVKPLNLRTFQENNPCNRKGPRNGQMGKKRNFIPKQNTHDLLVGTLSIGIPSLCLCVYLCVIFHVKHKQLPFLAVLTWFPILGKSKMATIIGDVTGLQQRYHP